MAHIHCRLPKDVDPVVNDQGISQPSCKYNFILTFTFFRLIHFFEVHTVWKYQYRTQCLIPVVEEAFGAKAPNYATILKLDRRIRDFEIPISLQLGSPADNSQRSVGLPLSMQKYMLFCEKETSAFSYFSFPFTFITKIAKVFCIFIVLISLKPFATARTTRWRVNMPRQYLQLTAVHV